MTFLLDLTDDQKMILETLDRAARELGDFDSRRRRLRADPPDRMALWSDVADLGALGLCHSEDMGGLGGAPRDMAVLAAGLAAALPVEPFLSVGVTAARLIEASGDTALAEALVSGGAVVVPALTETADPFAPVRCAATRAGDDWLLSGQKPAVRHADVATHLLVAARAEDGTLGVFLCPADARGLTRQPFRLVDDAGAADLAFEDTPATCLISGADAAVDEALDWTIAALCVETAAICQAVNTATFAYMHERKQFGMALSRFQALQFKAADMQVAATEAAAAADLAIQALERTDPADRRREVITASLAADRNGRMVTHSAVQLHGGMGVSDELSISHYARRAAAIRAQVGITEARAAQLDPVA